MKGIFDFERNTRVGEGEVIVISNKVSTWKLPPMSLSLHDKNVLIREKFNQNPLSINHVTYK